MNFVHERNPSDVGFHVYKIIHVPIYSFKAPQLHSNANVLLETNASHTLAQEACTRPIIVQVIRILFMGITNRF